MNWYYVDGGQQAGPVDDAQLEELTRSGKIQPDTLVWREGMANWQPYAQAKAPGPSPGTPPVMGGGQAAPEAVCAECGRMFPTHEMIRHKTNYICAGCKPVFMQKLSEGMAGGGRMGWERVASGTATLEEVMARDYEHDLGGYFSRGWETFKNNAGIIIGVSVLVYFCLMAVNVVPYISFILSLILSGPVMGGLWIFYIKKVRGLDAGIGDAFGGFGPRFGQLLLAHLVSTLLTWLCLAPAGIVGFILMMMGSNSSGNSPFDSGMGIALIVLIVLFAIVGGCAAIYFSTCWVFAVPLVADKGMAFWPAMSLSRKVVAKHWWMAFLIYIVISLVATAGLLALCVGILVSAPVAFATLVCAYEKLFGDLTPES